MNSNRLIFKAVFFTLLFITCAFSQEYSFIYWVPYVDTEHHGLDITADSLSIYAFDDNTSIKIGNNKFSLQSGELKKIAKPQLKEGLEVVSDKPLQIEYLFWIEHFNLYEDGSLSYYILEKGNLGKEYWVPIPNEVVSICAIDDSTIISIGNNTFILNKGQTKRMPSLPIATQIISNKSIAVVAANYTSDHYSATYADQLLPTNLLGTKYFAPRQHEYSYQSSTDNSKIYILSISNSTMVNVNSDVFELNKGESKAITCINGLDISSNKPIYAVYVSSIHAEDPWSYTYRDYDFAFSLTPPELGIVDAFLPPAPASTHGFPEWQTCITSFIDNNKIYLSTNKHVRKTISLNSGQRAYFHEGEVPYWDSKTLQITSDFIVQVTTSFRGFWNKISEATHGGNVYSKVQLEQPDFLLFVSPDTAIAYVGGTASFQVSMDTLNGFNGSVSLSVSGLPSGCMPLFNPNTINVAYPSTLTIQIGASTPPGVYELNISGTNGAIAHSIKAVLRVHMSYPPNLYKVDGFQPGKGVIPGGQINYRISFDNLSNLMPIRNVVIIDTLPAGTTFVSATDQNTYNPSNNTVKWQLGGLAAGEPQKSVRLVVKVNSSVAVGSTIHNDCTIDSDDTPPTTQGVDTKVVAAADSVPIPIYASADSPQYAGDEFWVDIDVGDAENPVEHLYGVAFVVCYDALWFSLVSPYDRNVVPGDFLGPLNEVRMLSPILSMDSIATSITRIDTSRTSSGHGTVMKMKFRAKSETPNNTDACFRIVEVAANDSAWNNIQLIPRDLCITIVQPTGIRPNPFTPNGDGYNDRVEFNLNELMTNGGVIMIFDLWGTKVRHIENTFTWDGRDDAGNMLQPGSYLYIVKSKGRVIAKGVIGLAR